MRATRQKEEQYLYVIEQDEEEIIKKELAEKRKNCVLAVVSVIAGIIAPFIMDGDITCTIVFVAMAYLLLSEN